MTDFPLAELAGVAAWLAAAATVVGMVALLLFFSRGGPWGRINDAASVVLMLAMIPIALALAVITLERLATPALVIAAVGIGAMLVLAALQALLVVSRVTYERTRIPVLAIGTLVGAWYVLVAVTTGGTDVPDGLRLVAVVTGLAFAVTAYGFIVGGERHPASAVGGVVLFAGSLVFQVWLGALFLGGGLSIPRWNA